MEGTVSERELSGGVAFSIATEQDEADIRALLRDTPMPGRISLSFEREPNFFGDSNFPSEFKQTIVARDRGRLVCVGSCAIRPRYINGKSRRVGYLGGLRLDTQSAGRFSILRRGYNFFRQLQQDAPADFYFTSIAADNERARAFLERGLPGMPRYEFVTEFVTLLISTLACREVSPNVVYPDSTSELFDFVNERNSAYQFAPHWLAEDLSALYQSSTSSSLSWIRSEASKASENRNKSFPEFRSPHFEFCVLPTRQQIEACGALWDQREFKQIVVRDYSTGLMTLRPIVNTFWRLTRRPRLPAVGEAFSFAFVSHLASKTDTSLPGLIEQLANSACRRGLQSLMLGFASNDPRLEIVRGNFRCHEYSSRLYVVSWPGIGGTARELDNRVLAPEVALL